MDFKNILINDNILEKKILENIGGDNNNNEEKQLKIGETPNTEINLNQLWSNSF